MVAASDLPGSGVGNCLGTVPSLYFPGPGGTAVAEVTLRAYSGWEGLHAQGDDSRLRRTICQMWPLIATSDPIPPSCRTSLAVSSSPVQITLQGTPVHPVLNPEAEGDSYGILLTMPYR